MSASPVEPSERRGVVTRALMFAIDIYRMAISPARLPSCRYLPTCSEYAFEALGRHGALRGTWLAMRRLLRCHPFHAGGHDPVPPRVDADAPERSASGSSRATLRSVA